MGETKELKDVLTELGLNDQHMANIQLSVMYRTLFISWQISPSYYLTCMTGYSETKVDESLFDRLANDDALREKLSAPTKMVYGVRILSRRLY